MRVSHLLTASILFTITLASSVPSAQLNAIVEVIDDFSRADLEETGLSTINVLLQHLKRAQKNGIFSSSSSTDITTSTSTPKPDYNTVGQECGQGKLVVTIQESSAGIKKRPLAPSIPQSDPLCQCTAAEMRDNLKYPIGDHLKSMSEWSRCPEAVRDWALAAFLEASYVDSIIIFFDFLAPEAAALLAGRFEFTFEAIMRREDARSIVQLLEYFESKGLFKDVFNRKGSFYLLEVCSRLIFKSIEDDAKVAKVTGVVRRCSQLFYLVRRLLGDRQDTLPPVLIEGGLAHPIHLAIWYHQHVSKDYFEFLQGRADMNLQFLGELNQKKFPNWRFSDEMRKLKPHEMINYSENKNLAARSEELFLAQNPKIKAMKDSCYKPKNSKK